MSKFKEKLRQKHGCCVIGCSSLTGRDPYKFFRVVRADNSVTDKWLEAIGRKSSDGSAWVPSKSSRICSLHFDGNDLNALPTLHLPEPEAENTKKRERDGNNSSENSPESKSPVSFTRYML